ncbi:uncharacterized protein LOC131060189 [Cryptomeria japonica]|uniref:uncharacterized protein LOC131060189 n=1 Tax=Cryptomeria japonica TaxID=3369 RepID=UPI0027DA693F|nr:uncharacterized protein LOC131060189 [Cryptomeria japonica]
MVIVALDSTRPPKVTGELYEALVCICSTYVKNICSIYFVNNFGLLTYKIVFNLLQAPSKLPTNVLPFHLSRSPTRIIWDPTRPREKLQPPSRHPTDPQPHPIVEDIDEPRPASKRLDFDDPPQS